MHLQLQRKAQSELHFVTSMWGPVVCHHYIVLGVILENTSIVEFTKRILPKLAPNLRCLGQRGARGLTTVLNGALSWHMKLGLSHTLC